DNILTKGKDLSYPASVIDYFSGMVGQPDGGFPKELQKIVLKNKKPLSDRAGKTLPPADFKAIKKHIMEYNNISADRVNDRNIISYALYPKVYDDFCKHLEYYKDVSRLESHVFFYGLKKGEETIVQLGKGKDLTIRFVDMTEPNDEGVRTLTFEINGITREINIVDKKQEESIIKHPKAEKGNPRQVGSPIPGTISKVNVKVGDHIEKNSQLITVEAMKLETSILSTIDGIVKEVLVKEGDKVAIEDLLIVFE
ncbi:MAG: pyruvate carboxylase, partial [Clostridia bacterium]|nr:pyruvate carboxylase [Clostridia bacterium]